jgi:hypothetical protein
MLATLPRIPLVLAIVFSATFGVVIATPRVQPAEAAVVLAGVPADRPVEEYTGSFLDLTTTAMFERLGVTIYPEDKVYAFPDPTLGLGSRLEVYRAQVVQLVDGKTTKTVRTWAPTVAAFAEEQRLSLSEQDEVSLPLSEPLPLQSEAVSLKVTRVAIGRVHTTSAIAFSTEYRDDPTLEKGKQVKEQAGKAGVLTTTFEVRREDGAEVSRRKLSAVRTTEPVTEVIKRGTKVTVLDVGIASFYRSCGQGRFTAAHKTLPKGSRALVVNVANGKSVEVIIDDRGPFVPGRVIDLSCDAFAALGKTAAGVLSVRVEKL